MIKKNIFYLFVAILIVSCVALLSCTSNPLGEDKIAQENLEMTGTVLLSDAQNPEGIFVWMAGLDVGTRTDAEGNFLLTLPPPSAQNASGGLDGVFQVYFYCANYALETAEVLLREGQLVHGRADLDNEGRLNATRTLNKFLELESTADPATIPVQSNRLIGITVNVRTLGDSVTVGFPRSIGDLLGAVYLRNLETSELFIIKGPPSDDVDQVLADRQGHSRVLAFDLLQHPLPVGRYEVIPYVMVYHEPVPEELIEALGFNVDTIEEPLPAYLLIPFKRNLAVLEIEG